MLKPKNFEDFFLWRWLVIVQRFILWAASFVVVVTITVSVFMRYVLKTDLYGLEEVIILLAMWIYFIGGAYGSYEGSHITAEIMSVIIKNKKVMHYIKLFIAIVSLLVSVFFAVWGMQYLDLVLMIGGRTPALHIPLLLQRLPLTICFILMVIYNIYHVINLLIGREPVLIGKETGPESDEEGPKE